MLLEITIGATGQRSVMRGQVLGFEQSRTEGVWLEFADARLPRRAGDAALVARLQRRIATDLVVGLRGPSGFQMCRLVDVSMTGARLAGASASLMAGAEVELRFSSLPLASSNESGICRARVVRFEGGVSGLRFSRGDAPTRQLVTKLFSALQEYWARVPEVIHPPICCGPAGPLDPPLPRLARRA